MTSPISAEISKVTEGEAPGWYAILRMDRGHDIWLGPYETKEEAVAEAKRRLRDAP